MRLVRFERTCRISIGIHSDAALGLRVNPQAIA
jgi:hypothetical protein